MEKYVVLEGKAPKEEDNNKTIEYSLNFKTGEVTSNEKTN